MALMAPGLICQHCGSVSPGNSSRRWMHAGAALVVALPCALAAGPISLHSQSTAVILMIVAIAAGSLGLAIALQRPRCANCGHHSARVLILPRP